MIKALALLVMLSYPSEQTTWVWPEAVTHPEERQVLTSVPVMPVEITDISSYQ
jgi:hypothetical protein